MSYNNEKEPRIALGHTERFIDSDLYRRACVRFARVPPDPDLVNPLVSLIGKAFTTLL